MRVASSLGFLSVWLLLAAGCGGEASKSEPGEPAMQSDPGGEAGSGGEPAGDAGGGLGGESAAGGAPATGGAASTGGSGSPAGLPLPEGCKLSFLARETAGCQLDVACDGDGASTLCMEREKGVWNCNCTTAAATTSSYEVSGQGSASCAAVLEPCLVGPAPEFTGEPECTITSSASPTYCMKQNQCLRRLDLGEGVIAVEDSTLYAFCQRLNPTDPSDCGCDSPKNGTMRFDDLDLSQGCERIYEICLARE